MVHTLFARASAGHVRIEFLSESFTQQGGVSDSGIESFRQAVWTSPSVSSGAGGFAVPECARDVGVGLRDD